MSFFIQNARWLVATALLYFCSCFGQTFFISLFAGEIRQAFNLSHGDWGLIYSGGTLASAIAMLFFGGYIDKYKITLNIKVVIISLSLLCLTMTFVNLIWCLPIIIFGLRFFGQGMLIHIPADIFHETINTSWESLKLIAIYAPPGPEDLLRDMAEQILPPGNLPDRN